VVVVVLVLVGSTGVPHGTISGAQASPSNDGGTHVQPGTAELHS
jgi:hypothetical protein